MFIKDVVDKAREAINYFVTNREFNIRSNNYGKPLSNNVFEFKGKRKQNRRGKKRKASAQRLDVRRLIRKSNKIVCDVIDYYLPLRNLQVKSLPTMELLESRDKVKKILQKFNSSKSIDTKVTQRRRIVKNRKKGRLGSETSLKYITFFTSITLLPSILIAIFSLILFI